ncbi:MAG: phosphate ABC transporter permease PstA [Alphaproteobacteria bacterium]|nr:phosphate ABC transporter permease PstA [Alphaproteobacteria bacterium]
MPDSLTRRHAFERRFRLMGKAAIGFAILVLLLLVGNLVMQGWKGFAQTRILVPITFDPAVIPDATDPKILAGADYHKLVREGMRKLFPDIQERPKLLQLYGLTSIGAGRQLQAMVLRDPLLRGKNQEIWLPADDLVDGFRKGYGPGTLSETQQLWLKGLEASNRLKLSFNASFFTSADSREPELAGVAAALMGSILTVFTCLALALPVGVATAVYLEEFAPKNRWIGLIEININNLAAVPSIIFGLLGLAVYLAVFGMPRSSALVGGLTLALMILPTLVVTTRASIQSVPSALRDAARGLGASPMQVVMHHVLPLATPGIMTGAILGVCRALGETAPLLMIGMVAFVANVPGGILDPATAMPVQVYLWADSPERAFSEKTAAAILVLLALLALLNAVAVWIRKKFERKW